MAIVTFYRGHPNPPKTTMPARLGANAIITCKGKLLLEKRRDSNVWGLVGGGVKKMKPSCRLWLGRFMKNWESEFPKNGFIN